MKNDFSSKIKKYLSYRQLKKNQNKQNHLNDNNNNNIPKENEKLKHTYTETNLIPNNTIKNFIPDTNNELINFTLNDKIYKYNFLPLSSINDNSISNNEENIKEDNATLFLEINQLKKDINLYQSRLNELTNEYNKLNKEYQENLMKNYSFEDINKEKEIEDEFIKLEEEKYKLKLNQLMNKNELLKQRKEKAIKHNQQLKNFYKIYMGEEWINNSHKNEY